MQSYIDHTDLSQPVFKRLREMILNNELLPGEKIKQEKIAKQLGVSRTPLLKALQMLEYELLVESVPRRGMFVKQFDLSEMIDVFDCREGLEGMAANLLAQRRTDADVQKLHKILAPFTKGTIKTEAYRKADNDFHQLIVDLCGNAMLKKLYFFGNIHSKVVRAGLVRAPEETLTEHINIIKAIEAGDGEAAEKEMRQHIHKSRNLLIASLNKAKEDKTES